MWNKLFISESFLEFLTRLFSAILMLSCTSWFSPEIVGKLSLAGSVGYFLSTLMNASWTLRLDPKSKHSLLRSQAIRETILLFFVALAFSWLFTLLAFPNIFLGGLLLVLVYLFSYLFQTLGEIELNSARNITEAAKIATLRVAIVIFLLPLLLFLQFTFKNQILQVILILIMNIFIYLATIYYYKVSINSIKKFNFRISISRNTIQYVCFNLLTISTFIVDSLVLARISGLEIYASYAVAFSLVSLIIGVFGTTLQRIYSWSAISKKKYFFFTVTSFVCILLIMVGNFGYIFVDESNQTLLVSFTLCPYFIPYAILRVNNLKLGLRHISSGNRSLYLWSSVVYLFVVILIGPTMIRFLGVNGMVFAVTLAMFLSSLILYRKIKTSNN